MKTLIAFYSRTGHTKKVAEIIAKNLNADLDEIVDLKDRSGLKGWLYAGRDAMKKYPTDIKTTKDPAKYDLVVVGTPIWAATSTPAVRTYLLQHKNDFKKIAVFTTSGGDRPDKTVAYLATLLPQKILASAGWTEADLKKADFPSVLKPFTDTLALL
jgi:flavodoxin